MSDTPKFVHSPIHVLPSLSALRGPKVAKAITMGRIARAVEDAVRNKPKKK